MKKQKDEAYVKRMSDAMVAKIEGRQNDLFGGIRGLARDACKREELVPLERENPVQIFQRALTTADFPSILSAVANKFLREAASRVPRTYELWTEKDTVRDFRPTKIVGVGFPGELPEVPEGGEYQMLDATEGGETAQIATRGGLFGISRQALVNDELGVFRRIPAAMGITSVRTMSRAAYRVLLGSDLLEDGKAVFHTDRGNLLDGPLNQANLGKAIAALRLQKDLSDSPLSVEPKYLVVPPSLEMTAWALCYALSLPGQDNSGVGNLFREKYGLVPVVAPELEDTTLGGTATNWFLSADPTVFPTPFIRITLDGNEPPMVEEKVIWETDQMGFKVRVDFAVAAVGWRGMIKSTGDGA
jgi:hypothetical protein